MPPPVRIALVNDYELVVAGLARLLTPFSARVEVVELDVREMPSEHSRTFWLPGQERAPG
ncbi:hypothetical protein [Calidifontibacter indicus]|uniref:hypothetical protein n=1 Tax=Calidifontibacter indicus TaxID=419650 RepID=UPI003D74B110